MVYLNIILTILCIILLSFLVFGFLLFRKFGKKFSNFQNPTNFPGFGDPEEMRESLKMMKNLMKMKNF